MPRFALPLKRWLFLLHRWLGVLMCSFFALWFVSGVVMMYVGYPKLTPAERLAHLPPLRATATLLEPGAALARAGITGPLQDLRLAIASGGRAVYLLQPQAPTATGHARPRRTAPLVIDAATGKRLGPIDQAHALASARTFAPQGTAMVYEKTVQEDAFTHSRALDPHRPLHRVQLEDAAGTVLYVSGTTGEVVRDATRTERWWNYAGAWLHWLYAFRGNAFDPYWTDIINTLSIVGIAVVLAGTWVGVMRWRFTHRYKNGRRTPYAPPMMRWHHVTGLWFAGITLTWIFSGLMSMNPWRVFDSGASALQLSAMHQGALQVPGDNSARVAQLLGAASPDARELRWSRAAGHDLVLAYSGTGAPRVLSAHTAQPQRLDVQQIAQAATRLIAAPVAHSEILTRYDTYYYARGEAAMLGGGERPLPMLRVMFADAPGSWVHIDPQTGTVLGRIDAHKRVNRWLFSMLHSWDWLPLLNHRPLWDVLLITGSTGGALLSITGVVIGIRRLAHKLRLRRPQPR